MPASPERPLLCGLHLQGVVETVEVVEQPDGASELHYFAFIKRATHLLPERFLHVAIAARHLLRKAQRDLLFVAEISAGLKLGKILDLVVSVAVPLCQSGMRCQ